MRNHEKSHDPVAFRDRSSWDFLRDKIELETSALVFHLAHLVYHSVFRFRYSYFAILQHAALHFLRSQKLIRHFAVRKTLKIIQYARMFLVYAADSS